VHFNRELTILSHGKAPITIVKPWLKEIVPFALIPKGITSFLSTLTYMYFIYFYFCSPWCFLFDYYSYDADNKQWKERGIGEMKVLFNPTAKSYRLLLRREQVHKVVCNMRISPGFELLPMKNSDKSWIMNGMNFAEGDADFEQLAVKFKEPATAQEFKSVVDECLDVLLST